MSRTPHTLGRDLPDTCDIFGLPIDPDAPYTIQTYQGHRYVTRAGLEPSKAKLQALQRSGHPSGVDGGGDKRPGADGHQGERDTVPLMSPVKP